METSEPIRVLLVEDNPGDVRLFRELIRDTGVSAFEFDVAGRLGAALERLRRGDIGLVLSDLSLPDSRGLATFQALHRAAPDVPVIVLSGLADEAMAVQAVHEGAQDYLVKGVGLGDGHLLVRAMHYAIERAKVGRQLERYAEELRRKNTQMEADMAMARELQLSFLPQQYPTFPPDCPPEHSALRFVHRYRPADAVGGDFFTVIPISDHAAGVFICDVMGHGLRAALLTAVLRGLMEELKGGAMDPPRFLADVSRSFHSVLRRTDETILATGFYLVADVAAGELRFASAGHASPLMFDRQHGVARDLQEGRAGRGPALGLFPEAVYPEARAKFSPGDAVILYTDGICEATGAGGDEFGLERLRGVIQSRWQRPVDEIFDEVLRSLQEFTGTPTLADDVALVGVEFAGPWPGSGRAGGLRGHPRTA